VPGHRAVGQREVGGAGDRIQPAQEEPHKRRHLQEGYALRCAAEKEYSCGDGEGVETVMPARDKCESQRVLGERPAVRVFISSTFRDMMQERELLMKKVFFHLHIRDPVQMLARRFFCTSRPPLRFSEEVVRPPFQAYPVRDNLRISFTITRLLVETCRVRVPMTSRSASPQ